MEVEQPSPPDFKTLVKDLVERHFEEKGHGLLLSRLGQSLRSQGVDLPAVLAGRKLSDAIAEELGDAISLTTSPIDPKIVSAMPKGKQATALPIRVPEPKATRPSIPRISPTVWAAFTKPIPEGYVRVVDLDPPSFTDLPEEKGTIFARRVAAKDITQRLPGVSKFDHEQQVFTCISTWLTEQGIPLHEITADTVSMRHANSKKSLFDQVFERLNEDQRKRLSLPIDVVESLIRG